MFEEIRVSKIVKLLSHDNFLQITQDALIVSRITCKTSFTIKVGKCNQEILLFFCYELDLQS